MFGCLIFKLNARVKIFKNFLHLRNMQYIVKANLYLAIFLASLLLLANGASIAFIFHGETMSHIESNDFSKGYGHSHHHFFEDDMLDGKEKVKTHESDILSNSLLFINPDFKDFFISKIWQPPKNS